MKQNYIRAGNASPLTLMWNKTLKSLKLMEKESLAMGRI